MAITNGYCTLAEIKASLAISDSVDDTPLEAAVTAASRMIDDYTNRFFYQDGSVQTPQSRYYTSVDNWRLSVDDFVSLTEVATDENMGYNYDTIWAATDYLVDPVNNPRRGWPLTRLTAVDRYIFPRYLPQSVKLTGIWGWSAVPAEVNMACLLQAARLFVRRQSPFGIAGSPDLGTVRLFSKLDADVETLVRPLRRRFGSE